MYTQALAAFHHHPNAILNDKTNGIRLRRALLIEEFAELLCAMHGLPDGAAPVLTEQFQHALTAAEVAYAHQVTEPDVRSIARESADVKYVLFGTDLVYGIDADAAFVEVHRAAMDKMEANVRREDGKVLKPPGFTPPDMTAAVAGSGPVQHGGRDHGC